MLSFLGAFRSHDGHVCLWILGTSADLDGTGASLVAAAPAALPHIIRMATELITINIRARPMAGSGNIAKKRVGQRQWSTVLGVRGLLC